MQTLRATSSEIKRLLERADALELSSGAILRLKWFEFALSHVGNVSLTCRHFGIARSTFVRWAERFDASKPQTIEEKSRRPHHVRAPETDAAIVELVRALRMAHPSLGKHHIHSMLQQLHGVTLSTSTVGRIIARHKLFFAPTASHERKRSMQMEVPDITPHRAKARSTHASDGTVGEALPPQADLGLQLS